MYRKNRHRKRGRIPFRIQRIKGFTKKQGERREKQTADEEKKQCR